MALYLTKPNKINMASSSSSSTCCKFVLSLILVIFFSLNKIHGLDETRTSDAESSFHSVHISALLSSSSTCKSSSSKGPSSKSTLRIVDRHGACFDGASNKPSLAQILSHDQTRAASIQARSAAAAAATISTTTAATDKTVEKKTTLPDKPGLSVGTGNYVVTVGLGSPKKDYTLVFDTGSDLTWTQCQPCVKSCYAQNDPIYNPSASGTYLNITCTSALCSQLVSGTGNIPGCSGSTCVYGVQYGDRSFSVGFFGKDSLTLGGDVFPGFLFGCGQNNQGLFGKTAGLLGLGQDPVSVVSQTAAKYGKVFSYCLPTKSGSNGYLSFGRGGYSRAIKYTPFSSSQSKQFYFVDITGVSVGGKVLPISAAVFSSGGTVVDSGTVITRLPPTAYSALSGEFKKQMKAYKSAPAFSILDTCFDLSGQTTIMVPKINFFFKGNANIDVPAKGILLPVSSSQVCLAFAGNGADSDVGIFGNTQQQTFQVVYNVAGGKLGFAPGGCS